MSKTLCELKKELKHDFDSYVSLVCQPRFVCKDCGRAANKKKSVCNPKKIDGAEPQPELVCLPQAEVISIDELLTANEWARYQLSRPSNGGEGSGGT